MSNSPPKVTFNGPPVMSSNNDAVWKEAAHQQGWADENGSPLFPQYAKTTADSNQAAVDRQTWQNRPNQYGPFASTTWREGADGTYGQYVNFNGQLGDASKGMQGELASQWGRPFDNGSAAREQAINAMYGQSVSRLNPQWDQRQQGMQSQLANQGLDANSEAYRNASAQFGRDRNDAYGSAMNNAIGMGNQAQALTFNQNMQARMAPLQAMQGMQGLSNPYGFNAAGNAGGTDYVGAWKDQLGLQQNAEKIANDYQADMTGAYMKFGGAVAGAASDERVKFGIHDTGLTGEYGLPLKTFQYKGAPGDEYLGYIAQDVEKVAPDQVSVGPDGVKMVSPSFAPQHLGRGSSGWDFLSPESRQLVAETSTAEEKRRALAKQMEMVKALRAGTGRQFHTPMGAAVGGLADIVTNFSASMKERRAEEDEKKLVAQQQEAFKRNADAEAEARRLAWVQELRRKDQSPSAPTGVGMDTDPYAQGR